MDSIADVLSNKDFARPDDIEIIKAYVRKKFDTDVKVRLSNGQIIITASSAALASALRFELPKLARAIKSDKKLILRIG